MVNNMINMTGGVVLVIEHVLTTHSPMDNTNLPVILGQTLVGAIPPVLETRRGFSDMVRK